MPIKFDLVTLLKWFFFPKKSRINQKIVWIYKNFCNTQRYLLVECYKKTYPNVLIWGLFFDHVLVLLYRHKLFMVDMIIFWVKFKTHV